MNAFCILGTEKETGGDGAGEVSTGVESESVVRRRRAVVTRQLVPLAGGPQHCLPVADSSQNRSRQLLEKAFDEVIPCLKWVAFQYYSSFTPCLYSIFSCFRSVLWRSFIVSDSGDRASAGVSLPFRSWRREESAPGSADDQLVLRNCSVWLRNSVVSLYVICLQSLMRCWANSVRGRPCHSSKPHVWATRQIPVERTLMRNNLVGGCAPDAPSRWRRDTLLGSWLSFSSRGPLMLQISWASFIAGCGGRMFRFVRTGSTKSSAIFRDTAIFLAMSDFALRHLVGGCWILTGTRSLKTSSGDSGKGLCLRH